MNIWFTSDLHLGHEAVIKYCSRPFASVDEMNEAIIGNYNARVKPEDTVYILGDLTLAPIKTAGPLIQRLNGKKILVQGNHDSYSRGQYLKLGFVDVYQKLEIDLLGRRITMCHFPYRPGLYYRIFKKEDFRYMHRRPIDDGKWLLHGHRHSGSKTKVRSKMIDVGVDAWGYRPVKLEELASIMDRTEKKK